MLLVPRPHGNGLPPVLTWFPGAQGDPPLGWRSGHSIPHCSSVSRFAVTPREIMQLCILYTFCPVFEP